MKIAVVDDWSKSEKASAQGEKYVRLAWDGEYRKGDSIVFSELTKDAYYVVNVDSCVGEALVLVKDSTITYVVPFYEKKTSYNPIAFVGNRHYVSIREATDYEISSYRNLAKNPFDQHEESSVYPHAYANVETRGEAVFAARNAIDGVVATRSHGEWPYESWGINRQDDAEITIDFGREVDIDEIRLYTRADFPHDNWWVKGTFKFSDGSSETVSMDKHEDDPHIFKIKKNAITYLKLGDLIKADDPSPFPALTQIEVYGKNTNN